MSKSAHRIASPEACGANRLGHTFHPFLPFSSHKNPCTFAAMSKGVWYMALAVFFFSLMNLGVKLVQHLPTFELVFFRSVVAGSMAYATLKIKGIYPWGKRRDLLALRGLLGFMALSAYFYTVQHMPLATAATIQYLSPIFVAILSGMLLGERMKPIQWIWFALSFVGVVLIKGFDTRIDTLALGLGIGSAAMSGLAYTLVRKLRNTDHPLVITLFFPLVAIPLSGGAMAYDFVLPQGWEWPILIGTGVFAQLGQLFMTWSLHHEQANIVGSMIYLGILFALPYGYFFFHETYDLKSLAGIILVMAGVALNVILTLRNQRKQKANV